MVDINSTNAGLQGQLQAQLQSNRVNARPNPANVNQGTPQQEIAREPNARVNENIPASRRLPVRQSERAGQLSTPQELEAAQQRVAEETGVPLREAPVGRLSVQQEQERNQPLGQIIDIRV
ncbi:hypothetical protein [Kordiimonas laminariae]|uniref:hypothetical protein n=1 Tax=Kordiimonas laminariae TaxID=2917717 RepID=UPI001FF2610E|nr:hypothetical protein [Kordiimonas laminariae]MCK0069991.1 hypothetical protein [Kordiimonas laminariae]